MPAWLPWMVVLQPAGGNTHAITMLLPVGSEIEYLYTRSGWDSVERGDVCASIPNRELTVVGSDPILVEDTIIAWRDLDCDGQ